MTDTEELELNIALHPLINALAAQERRTLLYIGQRLLSGQRQYGPLRLLSDPRPWSEERRQELADAILYTAFAAIKEELAQEAAEEGGAGQSSPAAPPEPERHNVAQRHKPCPCGSGVAHVRCHGRPAPIPGRHKVVTTRVLEPRTVFVGDHETACVLARQLSHETGHIYIAVPE